MLEWFQEHLTTILWTMGISAVLVVATMVVIPIVLVKLPSDYLKRQERGKSASGSKRSGKVWVIARNVLGWLMIAAGIAMLILPGQGVLAILIGVMLADFPGKRQLQRWIMTREKILKGANKLRDRFGKPPLEVPGPTEATTG